MEREGAAVSPRPDWNWCGLRTLLRKICDRYLQWLARGQFEPAIVFSLQLSRSEKPPSQFRPAGIFSRWRSRIHILKCFLFVLFPRCHSRREFQWATAYRRDDGHAQWVP